MVVVGTDGSGSALGAVERAAVIADGSGASVVVVCAYSTMTRREQAVAVTQLGDTRFDQVIGEEAAEAALAAGCKRAQESGATRVERGSSRATPCSAAAGRRGTSSATGGSTPGSAASRIGAVADLAPSPRDVLIVHTVEGGKGV